MVSGQCFFSYYSPLTTHHSQFTIAHSPRISMILKDYYQTLKVPATASSEEIKKAFRKLALQYHPDKNMDTVSATKKFMEIQEAYAVLGDKIKRAAYNYQRYLQNPQRVNKPLPKSADDILQLSSSLQKKIAIIDPFRIDLDILSFEVNDILSDDNMHLLLNTGDVDINRRIIMDILTCIRPLPLQTIINTSILLKQLAGSDFTAQKEITDCITQVKWLHYWNKYKIYIALTVALICCLIIFLSGR